VISATQVDFTGLRPRLIFLKEVGVSILSPSLEKYADAEAYVEAYREAFAARSRAIITSSERPN
jgi:hypothetical protein